MLLEVGAVQHGAISMVLPPECSEGITFKDFLGVLSAVEWGSSWSDQQILGNSDAGEPLQQD